MSNATLSYRGVDLLLRLNLDRFVWILTIAICLMIATYFAA
ncbi:hypothetical protein [Tritonibacter litoralis]|nr:hypothetical protein [Tritonibacter litoralis]